MSLRTKNLEAIVRKARELAELALSESESATLQDNARDLLVRINTHEAIHGSSTQ
jgi:hypothetical protein